MTLTPHAVSKTDTVTPASKYSIRSSSRQGTSILKDASNVLAVKNNFHREMEYRKQHEKL
jgi:hypothetical protein